MNEFYDLVLSILKQKEAFEPSEGIVHGIDGNVIDVRIASRNVIIRNVPVTGGTAGLRSGQTVNLTWSYGRPTASGLASTTAIAPLAEVIVDNDTIEHSPSGLRVRAAGIHPWHLSFSPSMEGHTHRDLMTRAGWTVDMDGSISQNNLFLHSDGQISLGQSPDLIKLDATHLTHRLWVGNVDPSLANFAVTKEGDMSAKSGDIAGWDILSDRLSKNDTELKASGELSLGTGDNVAVLSAVNQDNWRLWIGAADPAEAPFRVDKFGNATLESATISVDLQSSNYIPGTSGWYLDPLGSAEFQNVIIRGKATSFVFQTSSVTAISGRQIVTEGTVLIADVAKTDTTIDVADMIFSDGDIIYTKIANRFEWMEVTSDATPITGGFRYSVLRDAARDTTVKSLLHFNGVDASTSIVDEFERTWTVTGGAQLDTAQSKFGGSSLYLDGTGDYVETADSDDFNVGNDDFTIEGYIRLTTPNAWNTIFGQYDTVTATNRSVWAYVQQSDMSVSAVAYVGSSSYWLTGGTPVALDTWHHIAFVRNGTYIALYINGVLENIKYIGTDTVNNSTSSFMLGAHPGGGNPYEGWIDEFRFTKGKALYSVSVPPLMLLRFNGIDGSTAIRDTYSNKTWTAYGTAQIDTAQSKFGGASLFLDGDSDYVDTPDSANYVLGTNNFTIECWVRLASITGNNKTVAAQVTSGSVPNSSFYIYFEVSSGKFRGSVYSGSSTYTTTTTGGGTISIDTWYHVAFVRNGTTISLYVDGTLIGTATVGTASVNNGTSTFSIGSYPSGTTYLGGWIDEFRFLNGTCAYTDQFTPPTSQFLECFTPPAFEFTSIDKQEFKAGESIFYTGSVSGVNEGITEPPLFGEEEFGEAIFGGTGVSGLGGMLALEGSKESGPYFSVQRRDGPVWNQTSDVARIGRMRGFIGLNSDDYGFGVGDNQDNMYYTPSSGLRLNFGDGKIAIDKYGFTSDALGMYPEVPDYKDGAGLLYLDPDTLKVRLKTSYEGNQVDSLVQYDGSLPGVGFEHIRRYGFVDFDTSIGFNQSDKVFTLSGTTWRYYRGGRLCTVTGNKTVLIAPGTPYGLYFIYIDSDTGTLYSSTTPWTLSETDTKVPVALVLYNENQTPKYWVADERHTALVDRRTHRYLHLSNGTQHLSGGTLTGYVVQPSVPQNAHNTFQISETLIADEDIFHTLQTFVDNNGSEADHTFFYRNAGEWVWKMTNVPYSNAVNGYIHYDNSGTLAESSSGKYVNSYVLFTNFQGTARYTFVPGGQYSTLAGAEREDPMNFDWSQFPVQEVVVAYKFTWETNSTYGSLGKCRLALEPKRIIKNLKITDLLETYAVDIKTDTTNFGNIVLKTDTSVQAVIERLNTHSHDPSLTSTPFEGRLSLSASAGWADITMSSIIYFHRYTGTRLALWNGSYFAPYTIPATAMQLSTSGMLAGRCYDIFAYPIDGTTFGLEYTSWTSYKARNVDIMYYLGNYYKATDATRLYIGTAGCTTAGQVSDSTYRRNLWNYFNKENRAIYYSDAQDHSYTSAVWRLYNNQPEAYIHLVSGLGEMHHLTTALVANSASAPCHAGISYPDANITDGAQNYATVYTNYWEGCSTNVLNNFGLTNLYILQSGNTGCTYYDITVTGIFRS